MRESSGQKRTFIINSENEKEEEIETIFIGKEFKIYNENTFINTDDFRKYR